MSQAITLKDAEARALNLALCEDGLWDILLGCGLMTYSLYMVTRAALGPALNLLFLIAAFSVLGAGAHTARRHFVLPRIGRVNFGPAQQAKFEVINRVTIGLGVVSLVALLLVAIPGVNEPEWEGAPQWLRDFDIDILASILVIGVFALVSHVLGIPRLSRYGWLVGCAVLASAVMDIYYGYTFHVPMALAGAIILVIGCSLFVRFLRRYPVPAAEAQNAGS